MYLDVPNDAGGRRCVVVDPGLEPERIIDAIDRLDLTPAAILCTHGHADHIAGNAALKTRWPHTPSNPCPLVIGAGDAEKLTDPVGNLSAAFGIELVSPPADQTVVEGDELEFAGVAWSVVETPGHSCGHVAFIARQLAPMVVLGGDVLFAGGIGRFDFPDSDSEQLAQSIREKFYTLPDDAMVLPGHGPATTVGVEKRTNPYVRGS